MYAQVGYDQLLVNHAPPFTSGEQVHLVDLSGTCWSHVGHICALAPLTHWACENGVEPLPDIPDDAWQISRDPDGAWLLISSDGRGPSRSPAPYLRLLSPATDVTWMQDLSNFRSLVEVRAGACTCSLPRPCFHSRVLAWLEAQHPAAFTDLRTQGR